MLECPYATSADFPARLPALRVTWLLQHAKRDDSDYRRDRTKPIQNSAMYRQSEEWQNALAR